MDRNKKLKFQVNKLAQLNVDRVLGYEGASCLARSKELKDLFGQLICQSERYGRKLSAVMIFYDIKFSPASSFMGNVFRRWMRLRVFLGKTKDISVLKCCIEAERMIEKVYQFACDSEFLPHYYPLLKTIFVRQQLVLQKVKKSLEFALDTEHRIIEGIIFKRPVQLSNGI